MYFEENRDIDPNLKTNENYFNRKRTSYKLLKKNSKDLNLYFLKIYLKVMHHLFYHFENMSSNNIIIWMHFIFAS